IYLLIVFASFLLSFQLLPLMLLYVPLSVVLVLFYLLSFGLFDSIQLCPTVIVPVLFYVPLPTSKLHVFLTVFVFALTLLLLVLIFVVVLHLSRYPPLKFVLRQPSPSIVSFLSLYFF